MDFVEGRSMYISDDAIFMVRAGAWPPSGRPGREVAHPRKPAVHGPFLGGAFAAWRPLDQVGGLPRARIRFCSVRAGRRLRPLLVCGRAAGGRCWLSRGHRVCTAAFPIQLAGARGTDGGMS